MWCHCFYSEAMILQYSPEHVHFWLVMVVQLFGALLGRALAGDVQYYSTCQVIFMKYICALSLKRKLSIQ